ncbi:MAG: hypothetical protein AUJ85_01670 [Elusimicrobia bacterium CG1_02_37_114]|nr:MAG: hypothetical protein AUJ85_01670 [Elusimicrobia bacterium CG1_02_37_114]PIV53961.1 MAG: PemK family transcriptional regulator [Elusimicrobia bacterium CG02_land_8_20_14_3_00_37_13]PIZ13743.1 MAG: PemK family transcriptional regulator [Elusimicrobia bacterium CG_4_10_14_0_8_um_filter_37_32]
MLNDKILRGDIWILDYGKPQDSPIIAKKRPVVVIQNNVANNCGSTVIVTSITSTSKLEQLPIGVKLEPGETGLHNVSFANLSQITTVDKKRLEKKIGSVPKSEMEGINKAIRISLGIEQHTL